MLSHPLAPLGTETQGKFTVIECAEQHCVPWDLYHPTVCLGLCLPAAIMPMPPFQSMCILPKASAVYLWPKILFLITFALLGLCLDLVLWTCHFICPTLLCYCLWLPFLTFCFCPSFPCVCLSPSVSDGTSYIFYPVIIPGFQPLSDTSASHLKKAFSVSCFQIGDEIVCPAQNITQSPQMKAKLRSKGGDVHLKLA